MNQQANRYSDLRKYSVLIPLCLGAVATALLGCNEAVNPLPAGPGYPSRSEFEIVASSKAEIEKLLQLGMGTNEVVARIGRPAEEFAGVALNWEYAVTPFALDERGETMIVGVTLFFTNGFLAGWDFGFLVKNPNPMSRSNAGEEVIHSVVNGSFSISYYLVYDSAVEGGRYVDTPEFPKLGFIAENPDLVVARFRDEVVTEQLATNGAGDEAVWEFCFSLYPEDTSRFRDLTEKNLGGRLAIVIAEKIVAAPYVVEPIRDGRVRILCPKKAVAEKIRNRLLLN